MSADAVIPTRALISVSNKTGLVSLARLLSGHGVELLSTGGTAEELRRHGLTVQDVGAWTGFPEIMDGRVKTLHPRVHGGILGRRDHPGDAAAMRDHNIPPIDLVVVNLYPFAATVRAGADFDACVEQIDIGGPALIRAAAKNHAHVAVVTDPAQYELLVVELERHAGATTAAFRRRLAEAAFAATSAYDAAVAAWFSEQTGATFPERLTVTGVRRQELRYGENPHQSAALYVTDPDRVGVASAVQLQGKELSYNNIGDADAALELAAEFTNPAVAIIKHANPCGVAEADTVASAYRRALACDPVSAFGGIVAVNRALDGPTAEEISKLFVEVLIAPALDPEARDLLARKKNLRVLLTGRLPDPRAKGWVLRTVAGGFLLQDRDSRQTEATDLTVVSKRPPTARELADLVFAFRVAKHVKSNAIVYARDGATVGVGAGQMSRVDSARIAAIKAGEAAKAAGLATPLTVGSVVASDAFFPFADGLIAAAEAGATAVIQPGGSLRDQEVIAAADARDLAMVFTGVRHFRH